MKKDQINKIDDLMKLALHNKAQGDFSSAINLLEKILTLDPKNKKALNNRGNIYKDMRKFTDAIKSYSYAINVDSNYQIAKINLAILHHDLGNFNEAEMLYKELINQDKFNFSICFNLSRINFEYFDDDKISFIEKSLESENLSNYTIASGYFILAKNQELKKNFDKEIEFLKKGHEYFCKSINSKDFKQNLDYWLNIIPSKFNKIKYFENKKNKENINEINPIFIIGMPRSGSTLIESIISSGKLKIPNGGETAVINWGLFKTAKDTLFNYESNLSEINIDLNEFYKTIINKYKNLNLLDQNKKYFFTDKSLENFYYIDIILKIFPNAKFIHCKRNYLDTIFAIYQNFLTKMSWTHSLKDIAIYYDNYLKVIKYFSKIHQDKIFSLNLEELTDDSVRVTKEIFKFCNLEWSEDSLEFHKRKDLFTTTASNIQIRRKIHKYDKEKYKIYKKFIREFQNKFNWLKGLE